MFRKASLTVLAAMFLGGALALAKAPAAAPPGTTGMCKDGTYTSAASKSGACSGHDGVKKWYAAAAAASAPAASTSDKGASTGKTKSKSKSAAETPAADSATAPASSSSEKGASTSKSKKKAEPAAAASAAAPAAAATGMCKDGTSTSAASKSGACSGHGGVKDWYGAAGAMAPAPAPMSKAAPAAPAATPAPAAAPAKTGSYTPPTTPAPGGGQGQVWVNKPSKVYHCPGDQWYGKTKDGAYMSESSAIAQGYRADHGKACQ